MAQVLLKPPDPFNFQTPDDWPQWIARFNQFREAAGLAAESNEKQVNTLLYCMGEGVSSVLASTNITSDERKVYQKVVEKLDAFFKVRRNVIFERARFNRRCQREGEPIDTYIMELYKLTENCDYGALTAEMIRDRIVVGIRDETLSKRLQLDPDLTLEKAKRIVRQQEAVQEQQKVLKGMEDVTLDEASGSKRHVKGQPDSFPQRQQGKKCSRCGREQHPFSECPARKATCYRCHRKGHFSNCCLSKVLEDVSPQQSDLSPVFLETLSLASETSWTIKVKVEGENLSFKVDTGAEVTTISEKSYREINKPQLEKAGRKLYGPGRYPLRVIGQFSGKVSHNGRESIETIFVVAGLRTNLLGLPAIMALKLVARLEAVTVASVVDKFPALFEGLGNLGEPFDIRLQPGARPYALFTPRNIPIPLRQRVRQELDRMLLLGVISKVDIPSPWCAGMVVVPKKNGDIRICVDFRPLNSSVLREVHPLPKVDETLALLTGARIFSKLDANSGFWQIPLSERSKLLTTFITPYGRYCFNKMPFGISSAPEHFQKRMSRILEGIEGVVCQIDDILVFGKDQDQHDTRLMAVLKRVQSAGVTLNKDKCNFSMSQVQFLGHVIDQTGIRADPAKTAAIQNIEPPKTIPELRRFLGMVNQLGKFSPNLANITQPLRELLKKTRMWQWTEVQHKAFNEIKKELSQPTVLCIYDPNAETKISGDASSHGLGAVLLQKHDSVWKPVAYASRSLSDTEANYAQIEKEALACVWACEKFSTYVLGMRFMVETDHKPLLPYLGQNIWTNYHLGYLGLD